MWVENIQTMAYNGASTICKKRMHDFVWGIYRKVASISPSCFEAHAGLFRLPMKGKYLKIT